MAPALPLASGAPGGGSVLGQAPRHGDGDGLDARGSMRIDAMTRSSSARSAAETPFCDIALITCRVPSRSRMYTVSF